MPKSNLDLVVVLNRSANEETLSNFKQAVEFLVLQLGPHDRLSVIAVEEGAALVLPMDFVGTGYEKIMACLAAIDCIAVGNGKSNLCAGIKAGLEMVEQSSKTRIAVTAVFVITDVGECVAYALIVQSLSAWRSAEPWRDGHGRAD